MCDQALPEEGELLEEYGGDFKFGRIYTRIYTPSGSSSQFDTRFIILYKGEPPVLSMSAGLSMEYLIEPWDVGEDACGLCLIKS